MSISFASCTVDSMEILNMTDPKNKPHDLQLFRLLLPTSRSVYLLKKRKKNRTRNNTVRKKTPNTHIHTSVNPTTNIKRISHKAPIYSLRLAPSLKTCLKVCQPVSLPTSPTKTFTPETPSVPTHLSSLTEITPVPESINTAAFTSSPLPSILDTSTGLSVLTALVGPELRSGLISAAIALGHVTRVSARVGTKLGTEGKGSWLISLALVGVGLGGLWWGMGGESR